MIQIPIQTSSSRRLSARFALIGGCLVSAALSAADAEYFPLPSQTRFNQLLEEVHAFQDKASETSSDFIIGGRAASDSEFPATVALVDAKGKAYCTGTLLTPSLVATAAHCVFDLSYRGSPALKLFRAQQAPQAKAIEPEPFQQFSQDYLQQQLKAGIHLRIAGENYFSVASDIAMAESWVSFSQSMANYHLFKQKEFAVTANNVSDRALIKLNRKFEQVPILPMVSDAEVKAIHQGDYLTAVQVGYGLRVDPNEVKANASSRKEYKKNLAAVMDEKYIVTLPINFVFLGEEGYRAGVGKPGKAACFGDSGGPTYVQLSNQQWRYFASLSRGVSSDAACGESDPTLWPEHTSETIKQSTEFVDIWIKE